MEFHLKKVLKGADGPLELDVSLSLAEGQVLAVMGRSGVGKTSILRMLAGLMRPDAGYIRLNGSCWYDAERRIFLPVQKRSIGFVFQDYALFPNMSVRENLAFALPRGGDLRNIDRLLKWVGLQGLQHRKPALLSGGQRQRLALARALVRQPRLLLLDEPLAALDPETRFGLQQDLKALHEAFGTTTLLVSHDPLEIARLADEVIILEAGRILRQGSPAEVFDIPAVSGSEGQVLAINPAQGEMTVLTRQALLTLPWQEGIAAGDQVVLDLRKTESTKKPKS